jgi:hypothetical protein
MSAGLLRDGGGRDREHNGGEKNRTDTRTDQLVAHAA